MMRLAKWSSAGPPVRAGAPDASATAAAPSPNRLLTTEVRIVPSNTYAAEHTSMHTMTASRPGLFAAQPSAADSAFSPALQPMPTTSSRAHPYGRPSSLISNALNPGVMNPVDDTQHR